MTFEQIKERKQSTFCPSTGKLAHNPTGFLFVYLINYAISIINKK